jgi:3-methyl-2-oxobutanoate hydroxymethyltransferase
VDGDNLNGYDILGLFEEFVFKFIKQYKFLAQESLSGFNSFTGEVRSALYPRPEHGFNGGDEIQKLYPADRTIGELIA